MAKKRRARKRRGRGPAACNYDAALWTIPMGSRWSGLSPQYIRSEVRAGRIEGAAMGPEQDHSMPDGSTRRRCCAKFLIVAKSFKAFVDGLSGRGKPPKGKAA
jgi:hypothetical protein